MKVIRKGQYVKRKNGYYHYVATEDSYLGKASLRQTDKNYYLWEPVSEFVPAIKRKSDLTFFDYLRGIPVIILGILATGLKNAGLDHYSDSIMVKYYEKEYKLIGLKQPGKVKEVK